MNLSRDQSGESDPAQPTEIQCGALGSRSLQPGCVSTSSSISKDQVSLTG